MCSVAARVPLLLENDGRLLSVSQTSVQKAVERACDHDDEFVCCD